MDANSYGKFKFGGKLTGFQCKDDKYESGNNIIQVNWRVHESGKGILYHEGVHWQSKGLWAATFIAFMVDLS